MSQQATANDTKKNDYIEPCPKTPNCVSSIDTSRGHFIQPLEFSGSASKMQHKLLQIINQFKGARVVTFEKNFIEAEFISAVFRFVDDVRFYLDDRNKIVEELSYGRQRQVELALTAAQNPALIMLDEPTAGLSVTVTKDTIELIKRIAKGKTLLMVEHDMDVVFNLADRITVLNDGRMLATGSPDEIRENEDVKNAYLGRK